jgi:pimeloyl-ACP methyl ester carboxylesterase
MKFGTPSLASWIALAAGLACIAPPAFAGPDATPLMSALCRKKSAESVIQSASCPWLKGSQSGEASRGIRRRAEDVDLPRIVSETKILSLLSCEVTLVKAETRDPVTGALGQIEFYRYRSVAAVDPLPTVVISPTAMGNSPNEGTFARALCNRGMQAFVIKRVPSQWEATADWSSDENFLKRGESAIRGLARLSTGPVGVMGLSLGGVFASAAAAKDPGIRAVALVASGAPIADFFADTSVGKIKQQREERMARDNIKTRDAYLTQVKARLRSDPARLWSDAATPRPPVLAIVAGRDKMMPTPGQRNLAGLLHAEVIEEPGKGHLGTVFTSFFKHGQKIADFFQDKLGAAACD